MRNGARNPDPKSDFILGPTTRPDPRYAAKTGARAKIAAPGGPILATLFVPKVGVRFAIRNAGGVNGGASFPNRRSEFGLGRWCASYPRIGEKSGKIGAKRGVKMGVKMTEMGKMGREMGRSPSVAVTIRMRQPPLISNRASKLILEGYSILKTKREVCANDVIFCSKTAAEMV